MIENPIYGGTYAYGKRAVAAGYDGASVKVKSLLAGCGWMTPSKGCSSHGRWPWRYCGGRCCREGGRQRRDQVRKALRRDLEAARYAADRAFRQYDAADPANRLVTGELEARWNKALARVAEVEAKIAANDAVTVPSTVDPASFATLTVDLESV
jgi:hypothetical protein